MKPLQRKNLVLWSMIWLCPALCGADERGLAFLEAVAAYQSGDYPAAITTFTAIVQSGVQNGKLYYNLGNAHLKNDDLGKAILWYEKALKLLPNDPDLRFNHQFARSLTTDAHEEEARLVHIFFFWKYRLSPSTVIRTAVGGNLIFWTVLAAWLFSRHRTLRRIAVGVLIPTLIFTLTAAFNYYESAYRPRAIVLPVQTAVRSGLHAEATELFKLHAGARVRVLKALKDHYQIRFSENKIGWVPQDAIGIIP